MSQSNEHLLTNSEGREAEKHVNFDACIDQLPSDARMLLQVRKTL
jgi:hypothetical protein